MVGLRGSQLEIHHTRGMKYLIRSPVDFVVLIGKKITPINIEPWEEKTKKGIWQESALISSLSDKTVSVNKIFTIFFQFCNVTLACLGFCSLPVAEGDLTGAWRGQEEKFQKTPHWAQHFPQLQARREANT